ncbi:MAG TPA: protease inhibitor I42 family protein [Nitrospira sp.]|nr:protease inhibitor I42 family protein [Nitrospira sp.]
MPEIKEELFDQDKVIHAGLEQPIEIRLWEDRTRGELWIPTYDRTALALLSDDYLRVAGNNAVDNGQRTFEFKALKPGTHDVVFEKRMGWKFTAEDRRLFRVTVSAERNPDRG